MSDFKRNQPVQNGERSAQPSWNVQNHEEFMDPAQLGAQMQQGGVPLYSSNEPSDFLMQGDDAPTRVARPAVQPVAMRRTTAERSFTEEQTETPVRRRRSRVAERAAQPEQTAPQ